jgi:hypothetical protein
MERCKNCILPETYPGIYFNENGICNICLNFEKFKLIGDPELKKVFKSSRGKRYDCIVPLSGGRDSTYVLYAARKYYGLKVLAVNYDNEVRHEQAMINMTNACKTLGADFISIRSKNNYATKFVRDILKTTIPMGPHAVVTNISCTYGIYANIFRTAEEEEIPIILWGRSSNEQLASTADNAVDKIKVKKIEKAISNIKPIDKLFSRGSFYYVRSLFYRLCQRLEFPVSGNKKIGVDFPVLKNKNIKQVFFYDYIEWDRKKLVQTIQQELNWQKPSDHISTWRFDCRFSDLIMYCFVKQFGFSKRCIGYSNMIRDGKMTREEALRKELQQIVEIQKGETSLKINNFLRELRLPEKYIEIVENY